MKTQNLALIVVACATVAQLATAIYTPKANQVSLEYQKNYMSLVNEIKPRPITESCSLADVHSIVLLFLESYQENLKAEGKQPSLESYVEFLNFFDEHLDLFLEGCNELWKNQASLALNQDFTSSNDFLSAAHWMNFISEYKQKHVTTDASNAIKLVEMNPALQVELIAKGALESPEFEIVGQVNDKIAATSLIEISVAEPCRIVRGTTQSKTRRIPLQELVKILRLLFHPQGVFSRAPFIETTMQNSSFNYAGLYNLIEVCDFINEDWDAYLAKRVIVDDSPKTDSDQGIKYVDVEASSPIEKMYDELLLRTIENYQNTHPQYI